MLQRVPWQYGWCQGLVYQHLASCAEEPGDPAPSLHGEAVVVTRLGGIVCSGEHVAPSSAASPGQQSHTRAGYLEQVWEENFVF